MNEPQPKKDATLEKRRNLYAYGLLGCILAIAAIGLAGLWGLVGLEDASLTLKIFLTLIIVGTLSGYLYMLSFQQEEKNKAVLVWVSGAMGIALSGSLLLQIWLDLFNDVIFGKLIMTFIVIGVLSALVIALFDDFFENKKLKDENYLD